MRVARNRAVLKAHEKMAKDHARRRRDEQAAAAARGGGGELYEEGAQTNAEYLRRVEALKANDMEAYRQLLAEARGREGAEGLGASPGLSAADERYASLQEFLEKTEGYTQLGGEDRGPEAGPAEVGSRGARRRRGGSGGRDGGGGGGGGASRRGRGGGGGRAGPAGRRQEADGGDSKQKYYALAHTESEKIVSSPGC